MGDEENYINQHYCFVFFHHQFSILKAEEKQGK